MSEQTENTLNALFIVKTQQEASILSEVISSSGYKVNYTWIQNVMGLPEDINQTSWHIAIICVDSISNSLFDVFNAIKSIQKDVPIIGISAPNKNNISRGSLFAAGAKDVVLKSDNAHLLFVVAREVEVLNLRRAYEVLKTEVSNNFIIDQSMLAIEEVGDSDSMVEKIEKAIDRNSFKLLYQPIFGIQGDDWENYEVFSRLIDEDGSVIMPSDFIPVAERFGLMPSIDRIIVNNAIEKLSAIVEGRKLRFFVNLSSHSLVDPLMMEFIFKKLQKANLPPQSFVLEISKNTVLGRIEHAKNFNKTVKDLQLQFLLDHYEMEDTSLNYLSHIHVDYIKIHISLIESLMTDDEAALKIKKIIDVAKKNGIKSIAHGVENAGLMTKLYQCGVDYMQGYAVQPPTEFLDFDFGGGS